MQLAMRTRFLVREQLRGLDFRVYLVTRRGIRVLEESLSDRNSEAECGDVRGEWEASVVLPPVLAAGDYVLGVGICSPYQRLPDQEVLNFRLWPPSDERRSRSTGPHRPAWRPVAARRARRRPGRDS
jgi:hypothetical protein